MKGVWGRVMKEVSGNIRRRTTAVNFNAALPDKNLTGFQNLDDQENIFYSLCFRLDFCGIQKFTNVFNRWLKNYIDNRVCDEKNCNLVA